MPLHSAVGDDVAKLAWAMAKTQHMDLPLLDAMAQRVTSVCSAVLPLEEQGTGDLRVQRGPLLGRSSRVQTLEASARAQSATCGPPLADRSTSVCSAVLSTEEQDIVLVVQKLGRSQRAGYCPACSGYEGCGVDDSVRCCPSLGRAKRGAGRADKLASARWKLAHSMLALQGPF
eukprot:scaffold9943_cov22-Tisochrysis_lutea.AAC.2